MKTDLIHKKSSPGKLNGALFLVGVTVLIYMIFKIVRPHNFGNLSSLSSYFQQALLPTVAACGFYFIIVMGLFDFSIGANIVLSAIVGVLLSRSFGYLGLIVGPVLVGTLIGFINGILYVRLKIPSIIATVGLMMVYECIGALIASGSVLTLGQNVRAFGNAPWNIVLAVIAFLLAFIFLEHTKIGTYTYAIGSNETVAKNMGIAINTYKVIAFVLCGFFAGIMSILTISYGSAITASTNMSSMTRNFTPIMGCFFGLAFKKSVNPVIAMLVGEFIITMILNGLISLGAPTTIQNVITGCTLIGIVVLTTRVPKGAVVK
ncbi:ABC transporter permease [Sediminispirochaeta smaragdinae]|uniref:Inner-membrane translocator n=1 Tax=Sediminispirochaeta smaragdinae (strain DSM 11293 / JCM 15392 / SEBR 4228) TaxID=573413 RepID=E1RC89_SEDSS|nr:ABC transporter permease [Sediminispirochaeta smaragdinae]ADK79969.1 inner-membrane translocator [Sediminispirochaeta smaragdinae DSM 11293]